MCVCVCVCLCVRVCVCAYVRVRERVRVCVSMPQPIYEIKFLLYYVINMKSIYMYTRPYIYYDFVIF